MKRLYIFGLGILFLGTKVQSTEVILSHPPHSVSRIKEIAVVYNHNLVDCFNKLSPAERIFIYYMFRASLAGNVIAADQCHRDVPAIISLLEYVLDKKDDLLKKDLLFDQEQIHCFYACLPALHPQDVPTRVSRVCNARRVLR